MVSQVALWNGDVGNGDTYAGVFYDDLRLVRVEYERKLYHCGLKRARSSSGCRADIMYPPSLTYQGIE